MPETWISEEMRAAVGREVGDPVVSFPISLSDIRKWAQAVYYPEPPPPCYWDESDESTRRAGGIVAPQEFNPFAWMSAAGPPRPGAPTRNGPGPEQALGIAPPATSEMLNGGLDVTYTKIPMRPGDVITSVGVLTEYRERQGRLGLMLFTITEDRWTNQNGETVKTSRNILIRY